jgi:glycosyltransferase involved in cell wall biosynthesis
MKIAIDCRALEKKNWAGKEKYLISIIQGLASVDGENDYFLYFRGKISFPFKLPANFFVVAINIPSPSWHFFALFDMILKRVDVVFCPCAYLLAAINFIIPSVIVIHDLTVFIPGISQTHKKSTKLKEKLFLRFAISRARAVVADSYSTKKDIEKFFNIPSEKISVIHLAAGKEFEPKKNKDLLEEKLLKYKIKFPYILFVGTLEPRKNILGLLDAFKELVAQQETFGYKLVLAGKRGWYYEEIFKRIEDLRLREKVVITDYVLDEDLPYLYTGAECFIYPSFYEGFGLPALEALACGCPVITSDISSLPEVVGESALLVNPRDKKEIVSALNKILSDKELRANLVNKGLKQAQNFSWEKSAEDLLKIFREIKK